MMKLDDALKNIVTLGFDTAPLIYFVEANPQYDALVTEIFQRIDNGNLFGVTSSISLCEVLVQPFIKNDSTLQKAYRDLLLYSGNFATYSLDAFIAEQAASLRAKYGLKTPDALQIATALSKNCDAFLTNDKKLKRVSEITVLVLEELEL